MKSVLFLLKLLTAAVPLMLAGCDSGGIKAEHKEKSPPVEVSVDEMTFVDSSRGLPSSGLWRQGLAFYDINGDRHIDILAPPPRKASELDSKPVVWHGDGKGNWVKSQLNVPSDIGYSYGSVAVADFNKDGIADVALAMHGSALKVLKGTGRGQYEALNDGLPSPEAFLSRALVIDDFNNDGVPDIAAASEGMRIDNQGGSRKGVWVCEYSDTKWECAPIAKEKLDGFYADHLVTGDVNGDGNRDIAVASRLTFNHLVVWTGDGKGGFTPFIKGLPEGKIYYPSLALGDMNGDGKDDLAASIAGVGRDAILGLRAFLSVPDGFKEISEGLPEQQLFMAVAADDLNGDGKAEIIGGTMQGGIKIYTLKGDRWETMGVSGLPEKGLIRIYNVYCVDLNGDGRKDIAVNYASEKNGTGGIRVFFNMLTKNND